MKLVVLLTVLGLAATGQALKCYTCKSKKEISGVSVVSSALNVLKSASPCTEFDPSSPDEKFAQECPTLNGKSCIKITDPQDSTNVQRGCFATGGTECKDGQCFCTTDLCNSSGHSWPSALLLLAALAAALVGGR